ncbi:MAG: DUF3137 domain-containing protein [Lachnospiraceae bacterium]|nr:DUF3137 domain-containing protein [Lachnospiraceae bacterium]
MNVSWDELQKMQNGVRLLGIVSGIVTFVGILFTIAAFRTPPTGLLVLAGATMAAVIGWVTFARRQKEFRSAYKQLVINNAAAGMFDRYLYSPEAGISRDEIAATGIMSLGNRYSSEDMVEGVYKGVSFRRADMYIADHRSNGKSSYTVVYLRGSWLTFQYNKKFLADLQVCTKDFGYERAKTSRLFNSKEERRHKFETESIEFNRAFDCNCQQDAEAFYLLTPRVMQMLLLLKDEFDCPFMVGFVNNQLHFALNSGKNSMEPSVFGELNYTAEIEKNRRELKIITNIVDSLAIDRQIFTE